MKIKYNDIVGSLAPEEYSDSCMRCCFRYQNYIPCDGHHCFGTIFTKSESEIFDL